MNQEPLTPAEIQSLLVGGEPPAEAPAAPAANPPPAAEAAGQAPALEPRAAAGLRRIHDDFCKRLTTALSTLLRAEVRVRLAGVETVRWDELARRFPSPTCLAPLAA